MHYLDRAAQFVDTLRIDDIPPAVIARARLIVLDSLGVMIAGAAEPHVKNISKALRLRGSNGQSYFFSDGGLGDAADAALVNGIAICAHVAEEGHKYARGHVAAYVLPAVLAVAQEKRATGAEFLTAFVAGYELCARLGMACRVREGMHPSGTWGTVACAAAVAKLLGFTPAQIRESMNVAAPLTLATSWNAAEQGATVRDLYSGSGGSAAVWGPRWVLSGITGSEDDVSAVFGKISSEHFDMESAAGELGTRWEILRNYFKVHACCRNFQSAIDVALELRKTAGFDSSLISSISVDTFALPALHNASTRPRNVLAARESLPVSLALALQHGKCNQSVFTAEQVCSPETGRLAALVEVHIDPALEQLLPDNRPSRVSIALSSGRSFSGYSEVAAGDPRRPLTDEVLYSKFRTNAKPIGQRSVQALEASISSLEKLPSISALLDLIGSSYAREKAF